MEGRLLIGVRHDEIITPENGRYFLQRLNGYSHAIFEGDERLRRLYLHAVINGSLPNCEELAYVFFNGQKHFLEDNVKLSELASQYGIRQDLYGLYYLLMMQNKLALRRRETGEHFYDLARKSLENDRTVQGETLDTEVTIDRHRRLLHSSNPLLLPIVGNIFAWYTGRARDFEYICPKSRELDSSLDGNKLFILGIAHLEALEKSLRGEAVEKPLNWREYIRTLSAEKREFIEWLEDEICIP